VPTRSRFLHSGRNDRLVRSAFRGADSESVELRSTDSRGRLSPHRARMEAAPFPTLLVPYNALEVGQGGFYTAFVFGLRNGGATVVSGWDIGSVALCFFVATWPEDFAWELCRPCGAGVITSLSPLRGLLSLGFLATARAVGCILSPLCGCTGIRSSMGQRTRTLAGQPPGRRRYLVFPDAAVFGGS
jgi:hypothetical protein